MAMVSRERGEITKHLEAKEFSPEKKKASVVYYLSRNGHLEHPHFMEVTLSSSHGLYLKDVIKRLNALRGEGLAGLYSWSAKRSYKNGYVWHDLTKEDFIYPVHGHEYVLKGTELLVHNSSSCSESTIAATSSTSSSTEKLIEVPKSSQEVSNFSGPLRTSKKNNWGSFDLNQYYVYKSELMSYENNNTICNNISTDASTQTDERRQIGRKITELTRDEISPPPSSSSPETLEAVIKSSRLISGDEDRMVNNLRGKASGMIMHLVSCGISVKEQHGRSLTGGTRSHIGGSNRYGGDKIAVAKEYFNESFVEKKTSTELAAFKRCSSERGVKMELQKEMDGAHSRCMPRNSRTRKEHGNSYLPPISRSSRGSKIFNN